MDVRKLVRGMKFAVTVGVICRRAPF